MRKFLLTFLILFLCYQSYSQEHFKREFTIKKRSVELSITLAPNVGWIQIVGSANYKINSILRTGFSYGVLADIGINHNYFLSTACTITSINGRLHYPDLADIINTNYKLQYIEIPLTLKIKSNQKAFGKFYGQFGLGTGLKIKGEETGGSTEGPINNTSTTGKTLRSSLIIGLGTELAISTRLKLQTGITLNYGLTNNIIPFYSNDYKYKTDYIALNISLFF